MVFGHSYAATPIRRCRDPLRCRKMEKAEGGEDREDREDREDKEGWRRFSVQKPFSGKLVLRMSSELHGRLCRCCHRIWSLPSGLV